MGPIHFGTNHKNVQAMRTLATTFRKHGYDYELLKRNNVAAIFAQKSEGEVIAYETIKIKKFDVRGIGDRILEAGEYYPSTGSWGTDGFTCRNLERAEMYFNRFTEMANDPKSEKL